MIELLISRKSIVIIFETPEGRYRKDNKDSCWKIAFGDENKKILDPEFPQPKDAIVYARKMGFGGYRLFSKSWTHELRQQAGTRTLRGILTKKVTWKMAPIMFDDEKDWARIYRSRRR